MRSKTRFHPRNAGLDEAQDLEEVHSRMLKRLVHYRQFMHGNRDILDESVTRSKTAIGEPVSLVARSLKRCGIIPEDVNVFIHVDQYEEIGTISTGVDGPDYRSVVN